MVAKSSECEDERVAGDEQGERAEPTKTVRVKSSRRAVCEALNRLIRAGLGEIITLEAGAGIVDGTDRRARLREQIQRRVVFQRDLTAAVTALGGVPATHATGGARLAAGARRIRHLMIGPHEGDAYATCARATEKAATAYAQALKRQLPADVRFGIERQYAEVEWDHGELRRLRWGASLTPLPRGSLPMGPECPDANGANESPDDRALGVWSEEGGGGAGGSTTPHGLAEAMP